MHICGSLALACVVGWTCPIALVEEEDEVHANVDIDVVEDAEDVAKAPCSLQINQPVQQRATLVPKHAGTKNL